MHNVISPLASKHTDTEVISSSAVRNGAMTFSNPSELPKRENMEKSLCEYRYCWILVIYVDIYIKKPVPVVLCPQVFILLAL